MRKIAIEVYMKQASDYQTRQILNVKQLIENLEGLFNVKSAILNVSAKISVSKYGEIIEPITNQNERYKLLIATVDREAEKRKAGVRSLQKRMMFQN